MSKLLNSSIKVDVYYSNQKLIIVSKLSKAKEVKGNEMYIIHMSNVCV